MYIKEIVICLSIFLSRMTFVILYGYSFVYLHILHYYKNSALHTILYELTAHWSLESNCTPKTFIDGLPLILTFLISSSISWW